MSTIWPMDRVRYIKGALSRFYKYQQWCRVVYPNIHSIILVCNKFLIILV